MELFDPETLNTALGEILAWELDMLPQMRGRWQKRLLLMRLQERLPDCSTYELEQLIVECNTARDWIHELSERVWDGRITALEAKTATFEKFPWVNEENLARAF